MELDNFLTEDSPIVGELDLETIADYHTLRCDAKQAEQRFLKYDELMSEIDSFQLGDYVPDPFVKGRQPTYLDGTATEGVPVVNTMSIQDMRLQESELKLISESDYDDLDDKYKLRQGDLLLTVDGGPSIGKPYVFDREGQYTVDSHICIIRPEGMNATVLAYLLASPFGQLQFDRAESGASGQTAVTEDDIRRFMFPDVEMERLEDLVGELKRKRIQIHEQIEELKSRETTAWEEFNGHLADLL